MPRDRSFRERNYTSKGPVPADVSERGDQLCWKWLVQVAILHHVG